MIRIERAHANPAKDTTKAIENLTTINVIKIGKTTRRPATNFLLMFFLKSPV